MYCQVWTFGWVKLKTTIWKTVKNDVGLRWHAKSSTSASIYCCNSWKRGGAPAAPPYLPPIPQVKLMSPSFNSPFSGRCSKALVCSGRHSFSLNTRHSRSLPESMKCLNNRAESHLTGLVEQENDVVAGNGAWVNQGFCDTPVDIPRLVSTIYSPNPHFQDSVDSAYKMESIGPLPETAPPQHNDQSRKKRRGCCSLIKGQERLNLKMPLIRTSCLKLNWIRWHLISAKLWKFDCCYAQITPAVSDNIFREYNKKIWHDVH